MDNRTSSPPATGPLWAILCGLITLRGLDLGLASSTPSHGPPSLVFWLAVLGAILGGWITYRLLVKVLPKSWASRIPPVLAIVMTLSLPTLTGVTGYVQQRWAIADLFTLALTLLAAWSVVRLPSTGKLQRAVSVCFVLTAVIALVEHALGHAILNVELRVLLQGMLLCSVLLNIVQSLVPSQRFELRVSAALLAIPLVARLFAVGSWTALLGVAVPEAYATYTLGIWGICALGLCATSFPRGKGPSILAFSVSATLTIALVFLVYLHYLKRFGTIQAKFDIITLPVLGVHLPYPAWHSTAVSSMFAVTMIFAGLLVLRCLGQPETRQQGLALSLWFCAGIGLHRSLDLMCLTLAAVQLRHALGDEKRQRHRHTTT